MFTNPNWPEGLEEKCAKGENRKNVIDHYKSMETEVIKELLQEKRSELVLLLENFANDFNIATSIRTGNAFAVGAIEITGARRYDKRGTVGTHHYENINYSPTSVEVINAYREKGYRIVVADNIEGASRVNDYQWQPKTLLVMGQEAIGVSQTALDMADDVVYIEQFGSVRSMNVGAASAVMVYDYTSKVRG